MNVENPIIRAHRLGQSIWCDFLSRDLLRSGRLDEMIRSGVRGVTTNPSIFDSAIGKTSDYNADIVALGKKGKSTEEIYTALTVADVREAADRFLPVYEESGGRDGFVSLEVSPLLAHDEERTVEEALRLASLVDRKNVMIKIPATDEGMGAIRKAIASGISINATLMFSRDQYGKVAGAYISGLEDRLSRGLPVDEIASVASFFVSRVDTSVDKLLASRGDRELQGKIAIDNAKAVYRDFERLFSSHRWHSFEEKGAQIQRPLWASTGTKNPAYSPTLYVESLMGPFTVNTIPPATLEAFERVGELKTSVTEDRDGTDHRLGLLVTLGISLDEVTDTLLKEGVAAFEKSYLSLLGSIEKKGKTLSAE